MTITELYGSPTETGGESEAFTAQRVYQTAWGNRIAAVASLMEGHYPGVPEALARRFQVEGDGQSGGLENLGEGEVGVLEYEFAKITIDYSTARGDGGQEPETVIETVEEQEWVYRISERFEPTAEFLIPGNSGRLTLPYGGDQVPAGPGEVRPYLMRGGAYIVRVYDRVYLPDAWFDDLGKVNSDPLSSVTIETGVGTKRQFQAGTLQYAAMTADRELVYAWDGEAREYLWNVEFRFAFRAQPWNLVPIIKDDGEVAWVEPEVNGNPYQPYPEIAFTAAFREQWRVAA